MTNMMNGATQLSVVGDEIVVGGLGIVVLGLVGGLGLGFGNDGPGGLWVVVLALAGGCVVVLEGGGFCDDCLARLFHEAV